MKKKLLFSFMLVCVALFIYQGATLAGITGKISGVIKDATTGEPLPAVNIVIEGTTLGGATDNEGHYFIINIPPGTYTLQASMVGYAVESRTGIIVNVDHTTPVDFDLRVTAIAGEEVTVTAEREIIPMDISASQIVADAAEIVEVPMITDIAQYIHLQAGIEGNYVRGGGLDQTQFMMDGLMVVDNRSNKPMMMVNLSAVKQLNIIKGGFNAEYGNVRSGLINVVTKEGSPSVYHGSFDFRLTPAHLKHSGASMYNFDNYYIRPYVDPDVCWVGTDKGTWDDDTKGQYPDFQGWNAISEALMSDADPNNDRTPEDCRDFFLWMHMAEGSAALAPAGYDRPEGKYGHKPDWNVDASFGGPVPAIGKYLGNLTFFASYRNNQEMFAIPTSREYFKEQNGSLKLTSRLSSSMKLSVEALYGEINTVSRSVQGTSNDAYVSSGTDIFSTSLVTGAAIGAYSGTRIYYNSTLPPFDIQRLVGGLSFDHVLSPTTFYNIRISSVNVKNYCNTFAQHIRDTSVVRYFGNTPADEAPVGYWQPGSGVIMISQTGIRYVDDTCPFDFSSVSTLNFKFDLTSQVDRYNQIKLGLEANYDDIASEYGGEGMNYTMYKYDHFPYRIGAYVQDKLEFEGMIANFGVRLDYNDPNTDWYTVDVYSKYLSALYSKDFELIPKERAKGHLKVSPRLGISHPVSTNAKLYFNYGHFYSMGQSESLYVIRKTKRGQITRLGNPSALIPKTVSYELGFEQNVADLFLIHLSGYYKDVSDQVSSISYQNYDASVNYTTYANNNYADIRGFELRIDKRFGRFITGWFNYNYMVTTSGYFGRYRYYEDARMNILYGMRDPNQSRPIARPLARANINVRTPMAWGPRVAGVNPLSELRMSLLFSWRAGGYQTWDPLETFKLQSNLQWKDTYNFDARFGKLMRFGKYNLDIYVDVQNLFNIKYIADQGFSSSDDELLYLESLHLPMYEGDDYKAAGYTPGNDKPGDVKSKDKPYIDMPDRGFLTYLNPRTIFFGLRFNF